jgi:DNA-binding GntR family transcriptional regulator
MSASAKADPFCELTPIKRTESLATRVQDSLVELIIQRVLAPGQHIVETEVAKQLGVSRQPVREALGALSAHGWVDQFQGRGTFVHEPGEKEITDTLEFRVLLESEAARLAAHVATSRDHALLVSLATEGLDAVNNGNMQAAVRLDSAFHSKIAEISGNSYLKDSLDRLSRRARWYLQPLVEQRGSRSFEEHVEIAKLIAKRDGDRAAVQMRAHTGESMELAFGGAGPSIVRHSGSEMRSMGPADV